MGFEKVDCCDHSAYIKNVSTDEKVVESFESSHEEKSLFEDYNVNADSNKEVFGLKTLSPAKLLQNKEHLDPEIKAKYPLAREFGVYIL